MSGETKWGSRNYYIIVTALFLLVILLWLYLGGWKKQFNYFANTDGTKLLNINFGELQQKSKDQFSKLAPDAFKNKINLGSVVNSMIDTTLINSTRFQAVEVRYPEKWILVNDNATSTLRLLSTSGENFIFNSFELSTSTDPITGWYAFSNEEPLGWLWKKTKNGYVGFKTDKDLTTAVGLYQVGSSTVITLNRDSERPEKAQDGTIEMLITGLRK